MFKETHLSKLMESKSFCDIYSLSYSLMNLQSPYIHYSSLLILNSTMWTYLDHLDKVLSEIGDVLREKPEQEDISLSFTTESRRPSFIDPSESLRPVQTSSLHKLPEGMFYSL